MLYSAAAGGKRFVPHRPREIDLQLKRRRSLAIRQEASVCDAHRGVGDRTADAAMNGTHRIVVRRTRDHLNHCNPRLNRSRPKSHEFTQRN